MTSTKKLISSCSFLDSRHRLSARSGGGSGRDTAWWCAPAIVAVVAVWVAVHAAGASADDGETWIVETVTGEQLLDVLESEGYSATLDSDGDLVWKMDGYRTLLFVSGDNNNIIQFRAAFSSDDTFLSHVNDWNKTKRFSRSFLDDEEDPILELDLDLDGGVTNRRIVDFLRTCRGSFSLWVSEVVQ